MFDTLRDLNLLSQRDSVCSGRQPVTGREPRGRRRQHHPRLAGPRLGQHHKRLCGSRSRNEGKALATCEVLRGTVGAKRWKDEVTMMQFLRSLGPELCGVG
jgi:hypothetical protein